MNFRCKHVPRRCCSWLLGMRFGPQRFGRQVLSAALSLARRTRIFGVMGLACCLVVEFLHIATSSEAQRISGELSLQPPCPAQVHWKHLKNQELGAGAQWRPHLRDLVEAHVRDNPDFAVPVLEGLGSLIDLANGFAPANQHSCCTLSSTCDHTSSLKQKAICTERQTT